MAASKYESHRAFLDALLRLGRNATAIYQDLVDRHGFDGANPIAGTRRTGSLQRR